MECVTGMAWLTGSRDGPPVLVRGACDPLAGMHAVFATLLALAVRDRRGQGTLVEAVMVEAALNAAAEQVIEHDVAGRMLERSGNRGECAAPQGVYRCAGVDRWVAIAVASDEQWHALRSVLGSPAWAADDDLSSHAGRRRLHDRLDAELGQWTIDRDADEICEALIHAGVPAEVVIAARDVAHNPQLRHRGLFELERHAVTGEHEIPALPFRFSNVGRWTRRPSPMLGEHNAEVLGEVASEAELRRLRARGIIGDRPEGG
jgi:crotonobetainyl-CoA:carnitine CoA-transferase CaiB-like acyl-CoA transferase